MNLVKTYYCYINLDLECFSGPNPPPQQQGFNNQQQQGFNNQPNNQGFNQNQGNKYL